MLSKYGNCTRLRKIKNKLKIGCFYKKSREGSLDIMFLIFNKTIILHALLGYEMIITNSYPTRTRGIIVNYTENELVSDARGGGGGIIY